MDWFKLFFALFASSTRADVNLQTSQGMPISLSSLGININALGTLEFSLQTCSYGKILLTNSDPSGQNRSVVFGKTAGQYSYNGILRVCPPGDTWCLNYKTLETDYTPLNLCHNVVKLWVIWGNDIIKAGHFKIGQRKTLVASTSVIPVRDVIIETNSSAISTWVLHDVHVPTTIKTTHMTTATSTAIPMNLMSATEVTDNVNQTTSLTKGDNSTNDDQNHSILFKSSSVTLGNSDLIHMVFLMHLVCITVNV